MKLKQVHHITFDTQESIISAALSAPNELVMLLSEGRVLRYQIDSQQWKRLFSLKTNLTYQDGGFDIEAPSTIYTLDSIVILVNDYKRHGFVHYPNHYKRLHLWRKETAANHSRFPIALFKSEGGIPHLIFAADWNHLQVVNLDTRQVLTAAKSLIEEGAEERHIKFYQTYPESNKYLWPESYGYFYGKLSMSPSQKQFLSEGWVWGSYDAPRIFDLEHFINEPRIADTRLGTFEHSNRSVCWIDDATLALTYHPLEEEEEEEATPETPQEIHIYKLVAGSRPQLERKMPIPDLPLLSYTMHFSESLNCLVLFSTGLGVVLISLTGEIIFQDEAIKPHAYYPDWNLFITWERKSVEIHTVEG